jgi:hypothetical protein
MSWIQLSPTKENLSIIIKKQFTLLETETGRKIKAVKTDNGREYLSRDLESYLEDKGIKHNTSMPYTPQQNGEAERLNRTPQEKARPMLSEARLPLDMWGEAVTVANHLRNISPVSGKAQTPWELYYGVKPNLAHLRVFGCRAYVLIPKQQRTHKMAEVSEPGIMIGYAETGRGYRILLDDGGVKLSRDVSFDEDTFPGMEGEDDGPVPDLVEVDSDSDDGDSDGGSGGAGDDPEEEDTGDADAGSGSPSSNTPPTTTPQNSPQAPPPPSKPKRNAGRPLRYTTTIGMARVQEPRTYEEATSGEQAEMWRAAMDDEMRSLMENKTWEVVNMRDGLNVIELRWVYKLKLTPTGVIDRPKARLVAKGYRQVEGIDYTEVFAPVTKHNTIRSLLAVVAAEHWELEMLDIKTAFLNGLLEEEVYVNHPPGYPQGPPGTVLRLHKSLYGLKQAPRAWHQCLDTDVKKMSLLITTPPSCGPRFEAPETHLV